MQLNARDLTHWRKIEMKRTRFTPLKEDWNEQKNQEGINKWTVMTHESIGTWNTAAIVQEIHQVN